MDLTGKRLLIFEPLLRNYNSHHYRWSKALRQIHMERGCGVTVVGNHDLEREIVDELLAEPVLPDIKRSVPRRRIQGYRRRLQFATGIWRKSKLLYRELRDACSRAGPVDVVILPDAKEHHAMALFLLLLLMGKSAPQRSVLFLLEDLVPPDDSPAGSRFIDDAWAMKFTLWLLNRFVRRGEVVFATDSFTTASNYHTLTGTPVTTFPYFGSALDYCRDRRDSSGNDGPMTFCMLGHMNDYKGVDVYHDAIELYLERNPDTMNRFVLQCAQTIRRPDGRTFEVSPKLTRHPGFIFLPRELTDSEYQSFFCESDVVVLPYLPSLYRNRVSNVAVEAACSGKVLLVTENTWLHWALKEYGHGIAIPANDPPALADAFTKCASDKMAMVQGAADRQKVALNHNSTERYLSLIWNS